MTKELHPEVHRIALRFRAVGMPTPDAVRRKAQLLLRPQIAGEVVGLVVSDVVRCSTTVVAALAAGAEAITITVKGGAEGTTLREAHEVAETMGLSLVTGGELHGQPIAGGVLGNSPRLASPELLNGKFLHFSSTNFGSAFAELTRRSRTFTEEGGNAEMYVACFANAAIVAATLRQKNYSRVFVATGGFYNMTSYEDMVIGGQLLVQLGLPESDMDDDARAMVACALVTRSTGQQQASFTSNLIGQSLAFFGVGEDVKAVVDGQGIRSDIYENMRRIVPMVIWVQGVPVIVRHSLPSNLVMAGAFATATT